MKQLRTILTGLPAAALLLTTSCTKKIEEAFINPNANVRQPIELLMPNVIANMGISHAANGSLYGPQNDIQYVGRFIQNWATNTANNQFDQMSQATTNTTGAASDILGGIYAAHYFGQGANLSRIIEWGTEEKKWDYVGAAHAIRAWGWLSVTDMHGEVILKQAFEPDRRVFLFDEQKEVYEEVKRQVKLAIDFLNRSGDGVSEGNLAKGAEYFSLKGDREKWKKFAYGILARVYHRTTNKTAEYKPDSVIHYAKLSMSSNADNAYLLWENTNNMKRSYFGPTRGNIGAFRQTRFAADLMSGRNTLFLGVNDPRAYYMLRENGNGTFRGVTPTRGTQGLTGNDIPPNFWGGSGTAGTEAAARYVYKDGMPWPIMTASEMQFLIAEAYYRKNMKAEARDAYREGISLNFDMLATDYNFPSVPDARKITTAMKTTYLNDPVVMPTIANFSLSHIMLQKYIALFTWGAIETWVDMRRYHYTDIEPATGRQVYTDFSPPVPAELYPFNKGKLIYRSRPRFNSEFLYNLDELRRIGGDQLDYHTKEMWFSMP